MKGIAAFLAGVAAVLVASRIRRAVRTHRDDTLFRAIFERDVALPIVRFPDGRLGVRCASPVTTEPQGRIRVLESDVRDVEAWYVGSVWFFLFAAGCGGVLVATALGLAGLA